MNCKPIIGYTTGVFDLFHVGHLNILKKASQECDYLIVGVTACETVYQYKKRFPVIPLKERVAIVESIKFVDKVVVQETMDKISAWKNYKYDILFHGNDWKNSPMYNKIEKELRDLSVKTKFFNYTKQTSTTLLKEKIYEQVKNTI